MAHRKAERIRKQLAHIDTCLSDAQEYLARGQNVEGSGFLHLDDWRGSSGHPLWIRNHMIPTTLKARAAKEKNLDLVEKKAKDKTAKTSRRKAKNQTEPSSDD